MRRYVDCDLHLPSGLLAAIYTKTPEGQGILLIDINSGQTLTHIDNPYAQGPRLSPSGAQLAYFANGRIHVVQLKNQDENVIEVPGHDAGFCAWSPDGRALAFSAYPVSRAKLVPPDIYVYDSDNDEFTQRTSNPEVVDRFPEWSPSGRYLAFQRNHRTNSGNQSRIVVVDRDGDFELEFPCADGHNQKMTRLIWGPEDAYLCVVDRHDKDRRLMVIRAEDGAVVWTESSEDLEDGGFDPYTGRVLRAGKNELRLYGFLDGGVVEKVDLSGIGQVKTTLRGLAVVFDSGGEAAYFLSEDSRYYRWAFDGTVELLIDAEPKKRTRVASFIRDDYTFYARDGREIPVQRYVPNSPNGRAIVFVEGGPGERLDIDHPIVVRMVDEGFEVVRPAYRGCDGYGEEHRNANREVCGEADVWDVVDCGLDWKNRFGSDRPLAVSGFSYGGYLTFLALAYENTTWACGITF